jgi:hypothetical protein
MGVVIYFLFFGGARSRNCGGLEIISVGCGNALAAKKKVGSGSGGFLATGHSYGAWEPEEGRRRWHDLEITEGRAEALRTVRFRSRPPILVGV